MVRDKWELLAQRVDEAVELQAVIATVQYLLQPIAQKCTQALSVADAIDDLERSANTLRGEIHRKRVGPISRRARQIPCA